MSRNHLGVAAALILAMAIPAATLSFAAPKPKEAPVAPGAIAEKDRTRGMAEAPALAKTAGLACAVTDARWTVTSTDPKTKAKTEYYEVACDQGMGYIVLAPAGATPTVAPCYEANKPVGEKQTPSPLACKLPANLNLDAQLAVYVSKSGKACPIAKSRYIGASATKTFVEVACQDGAGYVLETGSPANLSEDVRMNSCLNYEAGQTISCTMTDKAAQLAVADKLIAGSGKACTVKDRRYVLSTTKGASWFEVACTDGKGYMIEQVADGKLGQALECAAADFVGGGCTLSDTRAAKTEQNGLYSRLAGKAGFKCDVSEYGIFSVPGKEVVELKCNDRPDGGIAVFQGSGGIVYNCAISEAFGYRCGFTKPELAYAAVTRDLKSVKPDTTCVVGKTRPLERATAETVYVELLCSDTAGGGYVLEYNRASGKPVSALICNQAKSLGGCKLS